jgi:hypothetical protein
VNVAPATPSRPVPLPHTSSLPRAARPPPSPGKKLLVITILFDTLGTDAFPVTAWAQGDIVTRNGTVGNTTFKITNTQRVTPGGAKNVDLSADNLMPGTWSVSVISTETGRVGGNSCQAFVPGTVIFNFTGGQGLQCLTAL